MSGNEGDLLIRHREIRTHSLYLPRQSIESIITCELMSFDSKSHILYVARNHLSTRARTSMAAGEPSLPFSDRDDVMVRVKGGRCSPLPAVISVLNIKSLHRLLLHFHIPMRPLKMDSFKNVLLQLALQKCWKTAPPTKPNLTRISQEFVAISDQVLRGQGGLRRGAMTE